MLVNTDASNTYITRMDKLIVRNAFCKLTNPLPHANWLVYFNENSIPPQKVRHEWSVGGKKLHEEIEEDFHEYEAI